MFGRGGLSRGSSLSLLVLSGGSRKSIRSIGKNECV